MPERTVVFDMSPMSGIPTANTLITNFNEKQLKTNITHSTNFIECRNYEEARKVFQMSHHLAESHRPKNEPGMTQFLQYV